MWQDCRAADFYNVGSTHRQISKQMDGRSQECTGSELQEIESTGKFYRESCREKTKTIMWTSSPHELWRRPLPLMGYNRLIHSFKRIWSEGCRKRGRRIRWRDEVDGDARELGLRNWWEKAQDRVNWRKLFQETKTQKWVVVPMMYVRSASTK